MSGNVHMREGDQKRATGLFYVLFFFKSMPFFFYTETARRLINPIRLQVKKKKLQMLQKLTT